MDNIDQKMFTLYKPNQGVQALPHSLIYSLINKKVATFVSKLQYTGIVYMGIWEAG